MEKTEICLLKWAELINFFLEKEERKKGAKKLLFAPNPEEKIVYNIQLKRIEILNETLPKILLEGFEPKFAHIKKSGERISNWKNLGKNNLILTLTGFNFAFFGKKTFAFKGMFKEFFPNEESVGEIYL